MIPAAYITNWRTKAPWPTDAQVEQDLVLSRALVEVFNIPLINQSLAFRGGTALHKLIFDPPGRYSEDIDLVQVRAGEIELLAQKPTNQPSAAPHIKNRAAAPPPATWQPLRSNPGTPSNVLMEWKPFRLSSCPKNFS